LFVRHRLIVVEGPDDWWGRRQPRLLIWTAATRAKALNLYAGKFSAGLKTRSPGLKSGAGTGLALHWSNTAGDPGLAFENWVSWLHQSAGETQVSNRDLGHPLNYSSAPFCLPFRLIRWAAGPIDRLQAEENWKTGQKRRTSGTKARLLPTNFGTAQAVPFQDQSLTLTLNPCNLLIFPQAP
jgi:hypothetical protein